MTLPFWVSRKNYNLAYNHQESFVHLQSDSGLPVLFPNVIDEIFQKVTDEIEFPLV